MITLPLFVINFFRRLQKIPDWVDAKFFPVPASDRDRMIYFRANVEKSAGMINRQISACTKIAHCYDAYDAIIDFKNIWGDDVQVLAWYDSLMLSLRSKEREILNSK